MRISALLVPGLLLFLPVAHADSKSQQMEPTPSEQLADPIELTDCPGVTIVEWRGAPGFEKTTGLTSRSLDIVNHACAHARQGFIPFLKHKGIRFNSSLVTFNQRVSLIPALTKYGGNKYRNLNDIHYRFSRRVRDLDSMGNPIPIWGYTNSISKFIFVRGDVLQESGVKNSRFITVFVHEMFHAMAFYYDLPRAADEELAMEFTEYLNLGR